MGQKVPIEIYLRIKHHGTANVSVVDTKTNTVVGKSLLSWTNYADERLATLPANNTKFDVVIPDLGDKCTAAGECVSLSSYFKSVVRTVR